MGLFGNIIPWFKRGPALNRQTVAMEQLMKGNALWGANPDTLVTAVTAYHAGNIAQLARIVDAYERQDDVAATGRMKRDASVARCEHTVLIEESHEDDPRAQLHRETLQRFWATIRCTSAFNRAERGGIRLLKKQMMSARTHGWSAHNILWHTDGGALRAEFIQIPMWHFENLTGELRFREHVTDWYGVPLWDGGWLINSATPIGPAVALACCAKRMSLQDWMLFSERAATPGLLGKTAAAPGTEAWNNLCEMLRRWSRAWTGAVDKDTEIMPVNLNTGTPPMPQLVERMDRAIAALYRGADLSTISKGEGLGASLQGEESDMLESDQCAEISEALHEQVDRRVIRYECGDDEPLAYIWIEPVSKPDVASNTQIDDHLAKFGIRLSKRDMLQRYGRAEAADEGDALEPPAQGFGDGQPQPFGALPNERRVAGLLQTALPPFKTASKDSGAQRAVSGADAPEGVFRAFAEAVSEDAKPLAEQVKKLLELIDAEKEAEAASFAASLSANLASYLPEDPESATVLAEAMAEKYGEVWEKAHAEARRRGELANSECRAKDPAHCPTHGTPREPETKKQHDRYGSTNEDTLVRSPRRNIERGRSAIEDVMRKRSGYVDNAMYRPETGWIRFEWGDAGDPAPDENGVTYRGGHGLSHIGAKHEPDLKDLPDILAEGTVYKHEDPDRLYVLKGTKFAVLRKLGKGRKVAITEFNSKNDPKQIAFIKNQPLATRPGENKGG